MNAREGRPNWDEAARSECAMRSLIRNPTVVSTELPGELVLLDPASGRLFTLNETGVVLWTEIEHGLDHVVEAVCARFEIDADTARRDLDELVDELSAAGLLVVR